MSLFQSHISLQLSTCYPLFPPKMAVATEICIRFAEHKPPWGSESLTPTRKKLFGEVNKERKRLKWKHIWTQNGRIFTKETDASRSFSFISYEDLAKFKSSPRH